MRKITRKFYLIILFVLGVGTIINAAITYKSKPTLGNQWIAESLFVGAEIMALHSSAPVKIKMKDIDRPTAATCALYLMNPVTDTAIFISTNKNTSTNEISIGTFPDNAMLVFMVKVIDTLIMFERYYDKIIYSGQNRAGIDQFISDRSVPITGYGARWSVVGQLAPAKIEMGFEERENMMFRGVVFEVENVAVAGVNIHKLPRPRATITDSAGGTYTIELICPAVPDTLLFPREHTFDTVATPLEKEKITLYYTLDGTDPTNSATRQLYTGSISAKSPATLKSYAKYANDSLWLRSDVATVKIGNQPTRSRQPLPVHQLLAGQQPEAMLFSINGRLLGKYRSVGSFSSKNHVPGVVIARVSGSGRSYVMPFVK